MKSNSSSLSLGLALGIAGMAVLVMRRRQQRATRTAPRRFGGAIKLLPHQFDRYTELHDSVWEGVLDRMYKSNMRNFIIYFHKETSTMFSHFEWIGHWDASVRSPEDEHALFVADMKAIADDPVTREWWALCEPCQQPFSQWPVGAKSLSEGGEGDWWAPLDCLNHCGYWPVEYSDRNRDPDFQPQNPKGRTMAQPKAVDIRVILQNSKPSVREQ
jgi:L-rhamnose mutarotase